MRLLFARWKNRALIVTMENPPAIVERIIYYADNEPLFKKLYDAWPEEA